MKITAVLVCATMFLVSLIMVPTAITAEKKKIEAPEYSREGVDSEKGYILITLTDIIDEDDPAGADNWQLAKYERWMVDRNKDGFTDIEHLELNFPGIKSESKREDIFRGYKVVHLRVDDNFDNDPDRVLIDAKDKKGRLGSDGEFESEKPYNLYIRLAKWLYNLNKG